MSLHITGTFSVTHFSTSVILVYNSSLASDSNNNTEDPESPILGDYLTTLPAVKAMFYALYIIIFIVGISGNVLVGYVVIRNKSMQTVTNILIANLAVSDILLCSFAVLCTPLYLLMREWLFGRVLCHLVPYAQGVSVYVSAFTLMSIALERVFATIYPLKSRLSVRHCLVIIISMWLTAALLTLPYGIYVDLFVTDSGTYCDEVWPYEHDPKVFGFSTLILQFVIPFLIITFCYSRVCIKLKNQAREKKEEIESVRTRCTNGMLIIRVVIFGGSWLPINIYNLIVDFYIAGSRWTLLNFTFLIVHAIATSSTCYNPFLYAWLNENFRKEFKTTLTSSGSASGGVSDNHSHRETVDQILTFRQEIPSNSEKSPNGDKKFHYNMVLWGEIPFRKQRFQKDRVAATETRSFTEGLCFSSISNNDDTCND